MTSVAPLRLALLAMPCDASAPVLAALLAAPGVAVVRVGLAGAATGGSAPERAATAAGVPAVGLRDVAAARALVAADAPDAVAVACFPWKLPAALLALPPLGCLNVHPSLLPLGRGPEPVFWTLRRGERETGASVIRMDAGWDTGPLLAQERLPVPLGVRAPALEAELMARGGRLLHHVLDGGRVHDGQHLLGLRLGGGQEAGSEPRHGYDSDGDFHGERTRS